jgi:uncharacterized protein YhaN
MPLTDKLRPASGDAVSRLEQRVADLEADLAEVRRHHLRLAELTDIVQELLVPMASRDEERIAEAIEHFRKTL